MSARQGFPEDGLLVLLFKKTFWLVGWVKESSFSLSLSFFFDVCFGVCGVIWFIVLFQIASPQFLSLHSPRLLLLHARMSFASKTHNFCDRQFWRQQSYQFLLAVLKQEITVYLAWSLFSSGADVSCVLVIWNQRLRPVRLTTNIFSLLL